VNVVTNGPLVFCAGNNVTLTANIQSSSPVNSIQWSNQSGNINGANSSSLNVQQSGNYSVHITNAAGCSSNSSIAAVITNPIPQGNINIPSQNYICEGQTTTLTSNANATQYQWYLNNVPISGATQASYNAVNPGTYGLQITTGEGCTNFASGNIQLSVYKKPTVAFQFAERCERLPIQFENNSDTSTSGPVIWNWNFGDGVSSNAYQPTHAYSNGNNYTVTLTAASLRCPSLTSTSNQLIQIAAPTPGIRYPTIDAIANNITPMQARNIGNQYLWRPTVGLSNPNIRDPYFRLNMPIEYQIKITTNNGCVTVDTVMTRMQFAIDIQVPTAFTPNGDGHNDWLDVFLIGIGKLKFFRVFNRWGQLLFETNDPRQLWDGTFHGKKQPAETYVWTAEGEGTDGKRVIRRGQTILIR
jgi:gliding motility-associated-like protein